MPPDYGPGVRFSSGRLQVLQDLSKASSYLFTITRQPGSATDVETELAPKETMKTGPNLGLTVVGGLVGTPAMTAAVYALATLMGVRIEIVGTLATMLDGWKMGC
jgi:hypothetical protein